MICDFRQTRIRYLMYQISKYLPSNISYLSRIWCRGVERKKEGLLPCSCGLCVCLNTFKHTHTKARKRNRISKNNSVNEYVMYIWTRKEPESFLLQRLKHQGGNHARKSYGSG